MSYMESLAYLPSQKLLETLSFVSISKISIVDFLKIWKPELAKHTIVEALIF